RLKARKGQNGELVLYDNQDETLWNQELITSGAIYLKEASQGTRISKYHFEASIAYWHTIKEDTKEKWGNILQLYNQLMQLEYSPIAALNRTYALAKANGKEAAIIEAEKLKLTDNHFYFVLLGELYKGIDHTKAKSHLEQALALAKTSTDKRTIQRSIDLL
ncbi:MAG: RNA polymerase subunit sigma, partial [Imperialibacter sp.]